MDQNTEIDVFISRKSEDAHLAKEIYEFLTRKGLNVFDSDHTLAELGNADYSRAIDDALVRSRHLIVIGSSVKNITSSWVEAEWRFFLNRIRSGKAKGNLMTIVTDSVIADDLPPSLQNFEIIPFDSKFHKLKYYIGFNDGFVGVNSDETEATMKAPNKPIPDHLILEYWDKAVLLYKDKNYLEAHRYLDLLVNSGHTKAQIMLGNLYRNGEGVPKNFSTALLWYLKAFEEGDINAQYNIGLMYLNGQGTAQDDSKAMKSFLKASEVGNKEAQYNIGLLFHYGRGVNQDHSAAKEWLTKSAKQGYQPALDNLLSLYGVSNIEDDIQRNTIFYNQKTIDLYNKGVDLLNESKYSEAYSFFWESAEQGYPESQYALGYLLFNGLGTQQDAAKAVFWLEKAAEKNVLNAYHALGICYEKKSDLTTAIKYYLISAELGHADSQFKAGFHYYFGGGYIGGGVQSDELVAKEWLIKAAKQGQKSAIELLNKFYGITKI